MRELSPASPFPIEALSPHLAAAARGIQAATQAPIDICANSVIASACLDAGHADVRLPSGELKPLSLYLITVCSIW